MTVIDSRTGEVLDALAAEAAPILSATAARDLTDRIRQTLTVGHDLIVEAFKGRAWTALGYSDWDSYCAGEFSSARMVRLDREQRREIVAEMREAGMSTRAVAAGLGIDHTTVVRDQSRGAHAPRDAAETYTPVTGIDGKTYTKPSVPAAKTGEAMPAPTVDQPRSNRSYTREERLVRIEHARQMAAGSSTTQQIADALGVGRDAARDMLKREGIDVPADRVMGKSRPRRDANEAMDQTVLDIEAMAFAIKFLDLNGLDRDRLAGWSDSLRESLQSLNRLTRQLKELDQP